MSDRLALANAIEDGGIDRGKAERIASVIIDAIHDNVATKADVQASEAALRSDLKADIAAFRAVVASEIARLDTRIERLDAKVEQIGTRTFNRLGTLMAVLSGIVIAVLHYWPPHIAP